MSFKNAMSHGVKMTFGGKALQVIASILAVVAVGCSPSAQTEQNSKISETASIMGGKPVDADSLVAKSTIFLTVGGYEDAFCSGVIIGKRAVLTAAHCVTEDIPKIRVGIGLGKRDENAVIMDVDHYEYHSGYKNGKEDNNDIGVIILKSDIPKSAQAIPVLQEDFEIKPGLSLVLAGFGLSTQNPEDMSPILLQTDSAVTKMNGKTEYYADESNNHGSCNGDSGGPSFTTVNNKLYLLGLVSRGDNGCKQYGVYTIPAKHLAWIRSVTKKYPEAGF